MSEKHSGVLVLLNEHLAVNANEVLYVVAAKDDDEDRRPCVKLRDGTEWRVGGGMPVKDIVKLVSKAKSRDVSAAVEKRVARVLDEFLVKLRREAPRLLSPVSVGVPTVLTDNEAERGAYERE
mgnify:CR=1 FL=1